MSITSDDIVQVCATAVLATFKADITADTSLQHRKASLWKKVV
jgi:hypothetical protein